jgi:uncharacterized protein (TIGR02145 family)
MRHLFILLISVLLIGCEEPIETITLDMPMDIDGNEYHVVAIGSQEWMVEDMRAIHLNDGTPITEVVSDKEWRETNAPAYFIHDGNVLYNYYCVDKLAPKGWHIPTDTEWKIFEIYLGMDEASANMLGWRGDGTADMLKSSDYYVVNGLQDVYGFKAIDTSGRNGYDGSIIDGSYWWCASMYDDKSAYMRSIYGGYSSIYRNTVSVNSGFSVRCIRNQ